MIGTTWCGGSGYLIRRTALDSIGGWPTESVGEDMYCSNILLGHGWKTLYVDESLQYGRVPESYKAHVKQQSRWVSLLSISNSLFAFCSRILILLLEEVVGS